MKQGIIGIFMRAKWAVNSQQLGPCVGPILNRSGQTAP
jgi:hypothetical protein